MLVYMFIALMCMHTITVIGVISLTDLKWGSSILIIVLGVVAVLCSMLALSGAAEISSTLDALRY